MKVQNTIQHKHEFNFVNATTDNPESNSKYGEGGSSMEIGQIARALANWANPIGLVFLYFVPYFLSV